MAVRGSRLPLLVLIAVVVAMAVPAWARAAGTPDLAMSAPTGLPSSAETITGFKVSDSVRNAGTAIAPKTTVSYLLSTDSSPSADDVPFATERKVPSLDAGQNDAGSVRIVVPASATSGEYHVVACVDALDRIAESHEGNDCAASAATISVLGPDPLRVTASPDASHSKVTQTVGPNGGSIQLLDDQAFFTLTIPPKALPVSTGVEVAAIGSISPDPGNVAPITGVTIRPAGLLLDRTATLTVQVGTKVPLTGRTGFSFAAGGRDFHLAPLTAPEQGKTFTVPLDEFNGYGVGTVVSSAQTGVRAAAAGAAAVNIPAGVVARFDQRVAGAGLNGDAASVDRVTTDFYTDVVAPSLDAAIASGDVDGMADAISAGIHALREQGMFGSDENGPSWSGAFFDQVRTALKQQFAAAFDRCTHGGDRVAEGRAMLGLQRQLLLLGDGTDDQTAQNEMSKVDTCFDFDYVVDLDAPSFIDQTQDHKDYQRWITFTKRAKHVTFPAKADPGVTSAPIAFVDRQSGVAGCGTVSWKTGSGDLHLRHALSTIERRAPGTVDGKVVPDAKVVLDTGLVLTPDDSSTTTLHVDASACDPPGGFDMTIDIGVQAVPIEIPAKGGSGTLTMDCLPDDGQCAPTAHTHCDQVNLSEALVCMRSEITLTVTTQQST
jgi:CARDB